MGTNFLPGCYITALSSTDFNFVVDIATAAGQTFEMNQLHFTKNFGGGETSPLQQWLREHNERETEKGNQYDYSHVYRNLDIYGVLTSGSYQDPDKMVARVAKTAYSFKNEYGARSFTVIAPELPFGRAERSPHDDPKVIGYMNTVQWLAKTWYQSGIDRVITIHAHNPLISEIFQEVYGNPEGEVLVNVNPVYFYADYFQRRSILRKSDYWKNGGENVVFIHLDKGSDILLSQLEEIMDLPNAIRVRFNKTRTDPNDVNKLIIELAEQYPADILKDKLIIIVDDIFDTLGTLVKVYRWIEDNYAKHNLGSPAGYYVAATHAVFNGPGFLDVQRKIGKELKKVREIVTFDSRPYIATHCDDPRFRTLASIILTAKIFAMIIKDNMMTRAKIEEMHSMRFKCDALYGKDYDLCRSESFGSNISQIPQGFLDQLYLVKK